MDSMAQGENRVDRTLQSYRSFFFFLFYLFIFLKSFSRQVSGSEKSLWFAMLRWSGGSSFVGGVSDDYLGGLGHGVLSDIPRQQQAQEYEDLSGGDDGALGGVGQEGGIV